MLEAASNYSESHARTHAQNQRRRIDPNHRQL